MNHRPSQSGSAFWIILIAIMLFAGLSYAVMQGRSGNITTLTNDQARVAAAEIIAYGDTLAKTVQTLKLRGCTDTQFDFANSVWTVNNGTARHAEGHNPNAPSDGSCGVFKTNGGKATATSFPLSSLSAGNPSGATSTKLGSSYVIAIAIPGIGTSLEDLVWMMPWPRTDVCMKTNDILGVQNLTATAPVHAFSISGLYNGTYSGTNSLTDTNNLLAGKSAFCSIDQSLNSNDHRFFRVLIAR